jgi:hypothetical protein
LGTLCLTVQSLSGSTVQAGTTARYAIWVWLTAGTKGRATIRLTATGGLSPVFSVCQPPGTGRCDVAGLAAGQKIELQASMAIPRKAAGSSVTLTAVGSSPQASQPANASGTIKVKAKPKPSPTPRRSTTPAGTNPGDGGTLPPPSIPGVSVPGVSVPGVSIPGLPNPTSNAGAAFPQVFPTASPSPHALPPARAIRAVDVSAGLPLNVRLIGGQLVGLAILAAAITIAVARLSLRKRPRRVDDDA